MELPAILAVLLGHPRLHANVVGVLATAAALLHRSNTLAVLPHHPRSVDIHDRHADRSDDNATRDREESVRSQRRAHAVRAVVLRQQVPTYSDHDNRVAMRLLLVPLPHLHAAELQVPVHISGFAGPDLERLGQQTHCHLGRTAFRSDSHSSALCYDIRQLCASGILDMEEKSYE